MIYIKHIIKLVINEIIYENKEHPKYKKHLNFFPNTFSCPRTKMIIFNNINITFFTMNYSKRNRYNNIQMLLI